MRLAFRIRSGCRGNGACGLCLVQIVAGNANLPTKNERLILSPEQIERNIRLACQLIPEKDLCIRIINTVSESGWRDLGPGQLPCTPSYLHPKTCCAISRDRLRPGCRPGNNAYQPLPLGPQAWPQGLRSHRHESSILLRHGCCDKADCGGAVAGKCS